MANIFSDLEKIHSNISELKQAIAVYKSQEKELQNIINDLSGSWDSEAGQKFVNDLCYQKIILQRSREVMESVVKVTERRYGIFLSLLDKANSNGTNGGFR